MRVRKNLAFSFFIWLSFLLSYLWLGPQSLFLIKLQEDLVLQTQTWKAVLSLTLLFACLFSSFSQ